VWPYSTAQHMPTGAQATQMGAHSEGLAQTSAEGMCTATRERLRAKDSHCSAEGMCNCNERTPSGRLANQLSCTLVLPHVIFILPSLYAELLGKQTRGKASKQAKRGSVQAQ